MLERFVRGIIEKEGKKAVIDIPVDKISVNPYQPRRHFNQHKLEQLAQSIKEQGVIQPIIVRPLGTGYELVTGERRLRASKLIGNKNVPAIVRNLSDQDMVEIVFIENLQREQLDVHEEAEAYRQLLSADAEGGTTDMVMRRVGKDMKSIQKRVWMLHLPPVVKKAVVSQLITPEHARLLSNISNEQKQCDLLERIYRDKLSVEDTRRIISGFATTDRIKEPGQEQSPAAAASRYSRNTIRRLDGCLLLVRELVAAIRDAGIPLSVTETLDGKTFEINLSFPVKNN